MATTTATHPDNSGVSTKETDKVPETKPVSPEDIKKAADLQVASKAVPLNTSEDAVLAFLRDQIDEDVLRQVIGRHGRISYHWMTREQIKAFDKKIPEDLVFDSPSEIQSQEEFLKNLQDKKDEKKKAMEDALKNSDDPLEKKALEADLERFHPTKKTQEK